MRTLWGADKATRIAARAIYIDKRSRLQPGPAGCAVYVHDYDAPQGHVYALTAFRGTAGKPELHYVYRTAERRQQVIDQFRASVKSQQERKAQQSAVKSAWVNPAKVGDILYTSWGYDQTNVEFYAVTKVSGKRVFVREIASEYEEKGFMSGECWPSMPIRFTGAESMHVAQMCGEKGYSVKINQSATAWLDEGKTHRTSSYA